MRSLSRAGLLGIISLFLFLGLAYRNWLLLSLIVPVMVLVFLQLSIRPRQNTNWRGEWIVPEGERYMEGDRIDVILRIHHNDKVSELGDVSITLPPDVQWNGEAAWPLMLPGKGSVDIPLNLLLTRRGRYVIGPVVVRWNDLLHLSSREGEICGTFELKVMPFVHPINKCDIHSHRVRLPSGNLESKILGPGMEFFSLRDFLDGDELRRINWKASARADRLIVNERMTERSGDVVVVVDVRSEATGRIRDPLMVDKSVEAAVSLAAYYLRQRDRVGLLVLGSYIDVLAAGYGRRQFHLIVERLLELHRDGHLSLSGVPLAVNRFFPTSALVLFVSALDDDRVAKNLGELVRKGRQVVVLSPTLTDDTEGDEAAALVRRMERLERNDTLFKVAHYCPVVEWRVDEPLSKQMLRRRTWQRSR